MKLLVSIDEHYISDDTRVYSTEGTTAYESFWSEYLTAFEQVLVLARVRNDPSHNGREETIANGPGVEFLRLPDFKGPYQYLPIRRRLLRQIREAIPKADVYFLRGPGLIGGLLAAELKRQDKAFAVQIAGDPWNVFGAGRVGGMLRPLLRQVFTRELKGMCRRAAGVSYVNRSVLQPRYPASPDAFVSCWSEVRIGSSLATQEELQIRLQRSANIANHPVRLGFVGNLEQPYKGADVLLRAIALCRAQGLEVLAELAGDGRLRGEYEYQARRLGLSECVKFLGRVGAGQPIFDFLDSIDLFVMPSLTEGLPRAMIEAMARGCPCIGSNVGGIPELLDPSDLVPPGDPRALADKITEKIRNPEQLEASARRNHHAATDYVPEVTRAKRSAFLRALRQRAMAAHQPEAPEPGTHLAFIVTVSLSLTFLRGQVKRLREAGFRITVICSSGPQTAEMEAEGAEVITVSMERELAPFKDARSLWKLWRVLRRIRPDIVNVGTPKAGLLGGMAARLARVPHRVYTLHGLRLETTRGPKRWLLWLTERIACADVQNVRCVSNTLKEAAIRLRLGKPKKFYVLGKGSANGIDCDYFACTPERMEQAQELRGKLGIPAEAPVIGFAGRLTRDKGIGELYRAFLRLSEKLPELRLLLLGDFEEGDPVDPDVRKGLENNRRVVMPGTVVDVAPYYRAMDVFALPSYREGLPTVSLEAQAASVPVVTTRVTGAAESVLDGWTGVLVPAGDSEALAAALEESVAYPDHRRRMGTAGAAWVQLQFRQEKVWEDIIADYQRMAGEQPQPVSPQLDEGASTL